MIERRKHAAIKTKIQRDHIVNVMEGMRTQKNWKSASKQLSAFLTPTSPSMSLGKDARRRQEPKLTKMASSEAEVRKIQALEDALPMDAKTLRAISNKEGKPVKTP